MREPKVTTVKGAVHGALALAGIYELLTCKTPVRRLLTGALVGWHLHATFYHLLLEKENEKVLDNEQKDW
jgi:hypothetical protein